MRFLPILVALAALLAGCTGVPAGTAQSGDEVTVRLLAVDPDDGLPVGSRIDEAGAIEHEGETVYAAQSLSAVLQQVFGSSLPEALQGLLTTENGTPRQAVPRDEVRRTLVDAGLSQNVSLQRTYTIAAGESGLADRVERAAIGVVVNDTARLDCSSTDPCSAERRTNATLGPFEIGRTIARSQFEGALGEPEVGMEFPLNELYDGRVTNFTETQVAYDILATDGQEDPAPAVGAVLVTRVAGDQYFWDLEPDPAATFLIPRPSGFNQQTPLGLEPGAYKTVGKEGQEIVYAYLPFFNTDLFASPYVLEVTVTDVASTPDEVPDAEEGVGQRDSPVLRDPDGAGSDHGHGDHQH